MWALIVFAYIWTTNGGPAVIGTFTSKEKCMAVGADIKSQFKKQYVSVNYICTQVKANNKYG